MSTEYEYSSAHTPPLTGIPIQVVFYGLPTAAVLALDLLQQIQSHPQSAPLRKARAFSRGKVIQDLSVFISSLRYVHAPGDGNYALTEQARKMLQKILDKALSIDNVCSCSLPSGNILLASQDTNLNRDPAANEPGSLFDLNWMDSTQFDAEFWLSLPEHPLLS